MTNQNVKRIVFTALFIALVTTFTFINIPFPGAAGGLMHLGTLMSLVIAIAFGKRYGMLAAGIGMAIFDVLGGWLAWAPGTLIVRLIMGFVVGMIAFDSRQGQGGNIIKNAVALVAGMIVMVIGYYFYEAIFLTTFEAAFASIPGNLIQFALGVAAIPIAFLLKEVMKKSNIEVSF